MKIRICLILLIFLPISDCSGAAKLAAKVADKFDDLIRFLTNHPNTGKGVARWLRDGSVEELHLLDSTDERFMKVVNGIFPIHLQVDSHEFQMSKKDFTLANIFQHFRDHYLAYAMELCVEDKDKVAQKFPYEDGTLDWLLLVAASKQSILKLIPCVYSH